MNEYTASNGIKVFVSHGLVEVDINPNVRTFYTEGGVTALREFFQAERDEALGRWRSTEFRGWVVYSSSFNPNTVKVLDEHAGRVFAFTRETLDGTGSAIAAEYFAAHPEPKPWHDAKPGEVWVLEYSNESPRAEITVTCVMDGDHLSFFNSRRLHMVHYTGIISGRRIWPEVAE